MDNHVHALHNLSSIDNNAAFIKVVNNTSQDSLSTAIATAYLYHLLVFGIAILLQTNLLEVSFNI